MKLDFPGQAASRAIAREIVEAETDNFLDIIKIARLDPAKDLRFTNWSGVDFSGCDLTGFDFTGARLHGCKFERAKIMGSSADPNPTRQQSEPRPAIENRAIFDQAELGRVIHRPGRDRHAPAEMTEIADLTKAKNWPLYLQQINAAAAISELEGSPTKTKRSSDAHLPNGAIFQDAPFGPQMVVIPAGAYLMGSPDGEGNDDEHPQHEVTIPQPFAVSRFAVTFDEWDAFVAAVGTKQKPDDKGWGRGNRPVINISHEDATAYAKWFSNVTGQDYRLPSEAEWEYACRAGTDKRYWWGNDISEEQANYGGGKLIRTAPVDSYGPNPWGLYQMHGNIWEWCADPWHGTYEEAPRDGAVWIEGADIRQRVLRGGSLRGSSQFLRSADRIRSRPDNRFSYYGFRLARTLR